MNAPKIINDRAEYRRQLIWWQISIQRERELEAKQREIEWLRELGEMLPAKAAVTVPPQGAAGDGPLFATVRETVLHRMNGHPVELCDLPRLLPEFNTTTCEATVFQLCREGVLERVGRGIYQKPRENGVKHE